MRQRKVASSIILFLYRVEKHSDVGDDATTKWRTIINKETSKFIHLSTFPILPGSLELPCHSLHTVANFRILRVVAKFLIQFG
ncbi:hypothetical protein AB595_14635 [Massilia sp. WF1]|nr:hypothetical protein AM586_08055 [Massilia sp. WG5]KLU36214.1 hypothetical protein AB595_14635 [Massilia sp. WF1]